MFKLSKFHRYAIALLALVIMLALFWPSRDKPPHETGQNQPIVIPPPITPELMPEPIITPPISEAIPENDPPQLPTEPGVISEPTDTTPNEPETVISPETAPESTPSRPSVNDWQNYRVQKGKTLAQIFRDNNLQANDAFTMARVEGVEKPLSNLQQGQNIRLKATAKGEVQLLETTASDGNTYSFARLSDGSYYRTP